MLLPAKALFIAMKPILDYTIETASWRDLKDLRMLEEECFGVDAWSLWDLIGVLSLPGIFRYKAVLDERMAGFVAGDAHPQENIGWITTIGVHKAFQRQGIARRLLKTCEAAMNLRYVRLSVARNNTAALLLYRSEGYYHVDTWLRYYNSGEDALVLEKDRETVDRV